MRFVIAVLSTAGLASIALVLVILGRLTAKFEAVSRKQSYYYVFYTLAVITVFLGGVYLYRIAALVPDELSVVNDTRELFREQIGLAGSPGRLRSWFHLVFYYFPLAITMTVSLLLAWRNWGWLLRASRPRATRTSRSSKEAYKAGPRQDNR